MHIARLFRTVRHLKSRQIFGQIVHRLRARFDNPARLAARPAPPAPGCNWRPAVPFLPPGAQPNKPDAIQAGRMTFVNQSVDVGWPPDWDRADLPKLWTYNLHYFEWLWAFSRSVDHAKRVTSDWIERYGPERERPGWEPYPISLRLMNWCVFFFAEHRDQTEADTVFKQALWASIRMQADWLSEHLEYHLLGNHLLENAAALTLVGTCFDGPDAQRWRALGMKLLREQAAEQILADGLHFERSPMYHCRMVYLLLTLLNTGGADLQSVVDPALKPMLDALARLLHPDGQIALLNDSAFGVYNDPAELFDFGTSVGVSSLAPEEQLGPWELPEAGYFGFRGAAGDYIVCDAGPIGPDYIPGHAHADHFSFELSLGGKRVIVDSGVHDYEWSETRRYCRSTRAHNTVEIEGQDQAEVWGAFRVARRGYPKDLVWTPTEAGFGLSAAHDGYGRLPGRPIHRRSFTYTSGGFLEVTDRVNSASDVSCRSFLHLHPDCRCERSGEDSVLVRHPAGRVSITFSGRGTLSLLDGHYHPEFHTTRDNTILVYDWTSDSRTGDSRTGDSRTGDSRTGDSRNGDSRNGDSRNGDSGRAESAFSIEPQP